MVGADPDALRAAGTALVDRAGLLAGRPEGLSQAATSVRSSEGHAQVVGAVDRFTAAFSALIDGVASEVDAMGRLARITAGDLDNATGGNGGDGAPSRAQ